MRRPIFRCVALAVIAICFGGCGKTDDQKNRDAAHARVDSEVAEYAAIASRVNANGSPNSSWSDADLTRLERDLRRLEELDALLWQEDHRHGVLIQGADNANAIRARREAIRQERMARASRDLRAAKGEARPDAKVEDMLYFSAQARRFEMEASLNELGEPSLGWPAEKLARFARGCGDYLAQIERARASLQASSKSESERIEIERDLGGRETRFQSLLQKANAFLRALERPSRSA